MSEEAKSPELTEISELSSEQRDEKRPKRRRVSEYSERMRARFLELFAETGCIETACKRLGISRSAHYTWLERYPDYREQFDKLNAQVADILEAEAWRRAKEGVKKPVFQMGRKVGEVREYSDFLMALLLKGRRRQVFGDRQEISGPNGGPITISPLGEVLRARRHKRGDES